MNDHRRCIWIVLDSVGIGAAPDAHRYGEADAQSHTLKHVAQSVEGLHAPNLARLGLGCIDEIPGLPCESPVGAYGKMQEMSFGKDTTNGHWEFVGVVLEQDLPVYPNGFPADVMGPFEQFVGQSALCNRPASGTWVIEAFGAEHQRTGAPIVYTSADSVFQIAAHEDIVPLETLYEWCAYARALLTGTHGVGRVIARPFIGSPGDYRRTHHRKDYSLSFGNTVLNQLSDNGCVVTGIGKIGDIYGGSGITESVHTESNDDGMRAILEVMARQKSGLIYANLVDFDSLYGHRNDPIGFARAIEMFDKQFTEVLANLSPDDLLCITADHGCDPTTPGTDHSREWVPLLLWSPKMRCPVSLGSRTTFADLGATVAEYFQVPYTMKYGESFWNAIADACANE